MAAVIVIFTNRKQKFEIFACLWYNKTSLSDRGAIATFYMYDDTEPARYMYIEVCTLNYMYSVFK